MALEKMVNFISFPNIAYFGWGERLFRFYSNSDSGFVRTGISILLERFYQARWHYRLGLFSL